jgi:hypothetical protein
MAVHSEGKSKMVNNAHKAPAKPVGNLATARKQQATMRQAEAEAKQRHPAGKQAPAKPALKPELGHLWRVFRSPLG